MSISHIEFKGKMLVSYGFSPYGEINEKVIESVNVFDYNKIDKLLESEDIEIVDGEISSSQLEIDDDIYYYVEEFDIFMSLQLEKYEEFIKVHTIYDNCVKCDNLDYICNKFNLEKKWICNKCHSKLF